MDQVKAMLDMLRRIAAERDEQFRAAEAEAEAAKHKCDNARILSHLADDAVRAVESLFDGRTGEVPF